MRWTVALVAAAMLAFTGSATAGVWLPPTPVLVAQDFFGNASIVNAGGDAVIVWDGGIYNRAIESTSRSAGGAWRTGEKVPGTAGERPTSEQLAADRLGHVYLAWAETTDSEVRSVTPDSEVRVAQRTGGGGWSASQLVGIGRLMDLAATADGRLIVMWRALVGTGPNEHWITMTRRRSAAGAWGAPQEVGQTGEGLVAIAMNDRGDALAVWEERDELLDENRLWSADAPATGDWGGPEKVGMPGEFTSLAVGLGDAGEAVVGWRRDGVFELARRPLSRVWQPADAPAQTAGPGAVNVAMNGAGDAAAVWDDGDGVSGMTRAAGKAWTGAVPLSQSASGPALSLNADGDVLAIWSATGLTGSVMEGRAGHAGAAWQDAQTLTSSNFSALVRRVSIDDEGNGLAVLTDRIGSSDRLYVVPFDAAPPRVTSLAVPTVATAGTPMRVSVSTLDVWSGLSGSPIWSFGDGTSARGNAVTHTFTAPGSYRVSMTQRDALGQPVTSTRTVNVVPPTVTLDGARLTAEFHRSRLKGKAKLRLSGRLSGGTSARLTPFLEGPARPRGRRDRFELPAVTMAPGALRTSVVVPHRVARRLLPGRYDLQLTGRAGPAAIAAAGRSLRLKSPREGVVLRVRMATSRRGDNLLRVSEARRLWAVFTFAPGALPARGAELRAEWYAPGRSRPVGTFPVKAPEPFSFWANPGGLAEGRWRCVLRAGERIVAVATVRIG